VAAGVARDLRGPACVIVKHGNPCGVAEADDMPAAWRHALAGDPVSAFGGVCAVTAPIDEALARALASIFLEVVVAPGVGPAAQPILAAKPNLRVLVDPGSASRRPARGRVPQRRGRGPRHRRRHRADDPGTWRLATSRAPTDQERRDLHLAWRIVRHVKSNAIVLVKDGALVGVGAGQMSRVDSARLAVAKAGRSARGCGLRLRCLLPVPDGVVACTEAGVTAFASREDLSATRKRLRQRKPPVVPCSSLACATSATERAAALGGGLESGPARARLPAEPGGSPGRQPREARTDG